MLLVMQLLLLLIVTSNAQQRSKQSLNSSWEFVLNDMPETSSLVNTAWQKINLPHTWNAKDIIDDTPGYHQGIGWYRKFIYLPRQDSGRHHELFFEGACNKTSVYINGQPAGAHEGGFTGFKINLDANVFFDQPNEILVKVDNSKSLRETIPPFSGDFNLMGGIYRDVWLLATNKIHFNNHSGNDGILFETPIVSASKATYRVKCYFVESSLPPNAKVEYRLSYQNSVVRSGKKAVKNKAGEVIVIDDALSAPNLWSPENPNLYELLVQLKNDKGELLDEIFQSVGFKWVGINDKNEFVLNGQPYKLKGASRHQDYRDLGNALPDAIHVKDIELMKRMGCNFIRIAHYPQDPAIYDACDRLGLLSWSEIPVVDMVVNNPAFFRNSKLMMEEMILQNYNHPSVAIWGYHNEVRNIEAATVSHAKMLDSIAKKADPSRLTAMAFESNLDAAYFYSPLFKEMLNIADINGYNVYQGWYRGRYKDIARFLDTLHAFNPKKPIMLSEYGAGSNTNIHTDDPTIFDFSEEYQCDFHEAYLKAGNTKSWMIGFAIWNFIDFQRDGREDVSPNVNNKGMVTTTRQTKDVFYFYRSQWSREPFIYITGKHWPERLVMLPAIVPGQEFQKNIIVYSNQPGLQLSCNGKVITPTSNGDGKFIFNVPFKEGNNNLFCKSGDGKLSDVLNVHYSFIDSSNIATNKSWRQLNFDVGQSRTFFTDTKSGEQWLPGKKYSKGSWGFVDGEVWNKWPSPSWNGIREGIHKPIANTNNETLYQTFVEGLTAWKADLPDGRYRVKLLLCEPFTPAQRNNVDRMMDISLNGELLMANLNLEKNYGVLSAVDLEKELTIKNGKGLNIEFSATSGKTILNGISILKY
jgi:beta-galactosidase